MLLADPGLATTSRRPPSSAASAACRVCHTHVCCGALHAFALPTGYKSPRGEGIDDRRKNPRLFLFQLRHILPSFTQHSTTPQSCLPPRCRRSSGTVGIALCSLTAGWATDVAAEFYNIINGQPRGGKDQHYGTNPATGEKLWPVPIGSQKDVDEAVDVARKAFESWRELSIEKRKEYLSKCKDVLLSNAEDMTELLCAETGKPKQIAQMETQGIAGWFDHHNTLDIPEERTEDDEKVITTRFTPLGVVGAICPW